MARIFKKCKNDLDNLVIRTRHSNIFERESFRMVRQVSRRCQPLSTMNRLTVCWKQWDELLKLHFVILLSAQKPIEHPTIADILIFIFYSARHKSDAFSSHPPKKITYSNHTDSNNKTKQILNLRCHNSNQSNNSTIQHILQRQPIFLRTGLQLILPRNRTAVPTFVHLSSLSPLRGRNGWRTRTTAKANEASSEKEVRRFKSTLPTCTNDEISQFVSIVKKNK